MKDVCRLNRAILSVGGPDAAGFLDNLLTQNVFNLGEAGFLYAALLSPQGKVAADMLLWREGEIILIDTSSKFAADLQRKLAMYKLRAAVTIADVSADHAVLWSPDPFEGARPDPRLSRATLGWRRIAATSGDVGSGDVAFDSHRLALGVPDLAQDMRDEEVFGLEALLEELSGVDFNKGCFVGQENVSRMKRRATTRRKFCPIAFDGDAIEPGTSILAGEADLGTVRSGAAGRAMALLRLDRALEAEASGKRLSAGGREVRLAPPDWLILPPPT